MCGIEAVQRAAPTANRIAGSQVHSLACANANVWREARRRIAR
jgi:hypothetical protein